MANQLPPPGGRGRDTDMHVHLAFAPRGPGLLHAVAWFAEGMHAGGWFLVARAGGFDAGFFLLREHFAARDTACLRSRAPGDPHGEWVAVDHDDGAAPASPHVSAWERRRLSRLHDTFVRRWLFFAGDPDGSVEAERLRTLGLPVGRANIRAARLGELRGGPEVLRHDSAHADPGVLGALTRCWSMQPEPAVAA